MSLPVAEPADRQAVLVPVGISAIRHFGACGEFAGRTSAQALKFPFQGHEPGLEIGLGVHDDFDLATRQAPNTPGMARAQRDHERLTMQTQAIGDLEDARDLRERDGFEHGHLLGRERDGFYASARVQR